MIVRRGRPLRAGVAREGMYFASLAPGLPTPANEVTDGTAGVLTLADGTLRRDGATVTLEPDNADAFGEFLRREFRVFSA